MSFRGFLVRCIEFLYQYEVFQVVELSLRLVLSNAPGEPDQRLNNISLQLFIQFTHTVL